MDFSALCERLDRQVTKRLSDKAVLDDVECRGIFSMAWREPRLGQMDTGLVEPHLKLRDADAATAKRGRRVTVGGRDHDVVSIEPDGTGWTALILREVRP